MTRTACLLALTAVFFLLTHPMVAEQKAETEKPEQEVKVEEQGRFRLGGIYLGGGYSRYSYNSPSLYHYPHYYRSHYPYYHPIDAWAHPGYYLGFDRTDSTGRIKLKTEHREASVFLNGAFAGVAKDLKEIWLEPGVYELKVAADLYEPFELRVYVLTGKTVKIEATLREKEKEHTP